jgi:beta-galactosidase
VIAPDFEWNGSAISHAAIFSNCERLDLFIDGQHVAAAQPDHAGFPHLAYPPFFCDLPGQGELRIDGYLGDRLALSRSFSAKPQFVIAADDPELIADGSDATRLAFQSGDRSGDVHFKLTGPGVILGDNPFHLADAGGVGAIWVKTLLKSPGQIVVEATHSTLGAKSVTIRSLPPHY